MIDTLAETLDIRRRRAAYRAAHRGTKEMDLMLGRYACAMLPGLIDPDLARFEQFLALPDPTLQGWLLTGATIDGSDFAGLVADVRRFHGL